MDSDEVSITGTQGRSSSTTTKKKQVGNIKLVSRSVGPWDWEGLGVEVCGSPQVIIL